jgi:hypothetical protein
MQNEKMMNENFEHMSANQLCEMLKIVSDLYIKYDTINDDENDGFNYGVHEHFRIQIDMITNYLITERKLTLRDIDEMTYTA